MYQVVFIALFSLLVSVDSFQNTVRVINANRIINSATPFPFAQNYLAKQSKLRDAHATPLSAGFDNLILP
jgi:hypothetical protein